ncbi:MAG: xylose isomerase, partial [Rhodopirellula sp. JB044]
YDLTDHFKLNIETNHATMAGHEMMHELEYAGMQGALGSIDANTGDLLLGWDTDQFATNYYLTTQSMLVLLKYGLAPGGVNFDAKVRRESFEPIDLFYAHIGSMDAFARGLKIAAKIIEDGALQKLVDNRYSSWDGDLGKKIEAGSMSFTELEKLMLEKGEAAPNGSGRQELLENIVNRYVDNA